jgi:hypothetical protein
MAILLRNTRTGFFYVSYNRWRVHPEDAFDFQTLERAAHWIKVTQLAGVEIIQAPNNTSSPYEDKREWVS